MKCLNCGRFVRLTQKFRNAIHADHAGSICPGSRKLQHRSRPISLAATMIYPVFRRFRLPGTEMLVNMRVSKDTMVDQAFELRRAFTLIELLAVIAIIGLVTVAVIGSGMLGVLEHRQLDQAALELNAAMSGARDRAILTGRPAGIRLLPDPAFPIHRLPDGRIDPAYPLVYNRWIPIEQPPDYTDGKLQLPTAAAP